MHKSNSFPAFSVKDISFQSFLSFNSETIEITLKNTHTIKYGIYTNGHVPNSLYA